MKLRLCLLVTMLVLIATKGFSQVTLSEKNTPLVEVIRSIEKQTGYFFIYDEAKVKLGNVSVVLRNASLDETLSQCFKNLPVTYNIIEKSIVLKPKPAAVTDSIRIKQETFSITGKVTDEKGETVPGAVVFLANTKSMTIANNEGVFKLKGILPGGYVLMVKLMGFTTYTQPITIQKQSVNIPVKLSDNNIALNEVIIADKTQPKQAKYMKLFIKNFIGETPNAAQCTILNPEVIKLHYDKKAKALKARSDDFIIIENKALGYKLNYLLINFQLNLAEVNTFTYEGNAYFEQLKCTKAQQEEWDYKRRVAYEGSIRHFFQASFNNTAEDEGFLAYRIPNKLNQQELAALHPVSINSLFTVINNDFKLLNLNTERSTDRLYIIYTREEEPSSFYNSAGHIELPGMVSKKIQVSHIEPFLSNILLDKNGSTIPANSVLFEGYWTREKVADLMPLDYTTVTNCAAKH